MVNSRSESLIATVLRRSRNKVVDDRHTRASRTHTLKPPHLIAESNAERRIRYDKCASRVLRIITGAGRASYLVGRRAPRLDRYGTINTFPPHFMLA